MLNAFAFFTRDKSGRPWPNGLTEPGACYFTVNGWDYIPNGPGCVWLWD